LKEVPRGEVILSGIPVQVGSVTIKAGSPWVVRVVLSAPSTLDQGHVEELKQIITDRTSENVLVEAQFSIRR
jgi:hypothetical protein